VASAGGEISIRSMSDSWAEPAANIHVEMRTFRPTLPAKAGEGG
jgi:hypothetical protein